MANGAFKFKDNSGNVVSFISGSGSDILISGGTLNLSGMTGLTLGNLTMSGTTQNAVSTSHAASYLLTSSFNSYTGTTNTIIGSLQTSTGSLNTFTSSTDGRLTSIETSTGSLNSYTTSTNTRLGVIESTTSSLNTYTSSTNTRLGVIESTTSSLNTFTSSASGRLNSIEGVTGSYATTGSNTFNGNLTVTGYIDAQELRTTYISSSILYRSGSTKFGDELTDTHTFTGSVLISGSLSVPGQNLTTGTGNGVSGQIVYFTGNNTIDGVSSFVWNNPNFVIGLSEASNNTDYKVLFQRHGTLANPGTWTNSVGLQIVDYAADGPASFQATGLVSIELPRIATNDTNAGNAVALRVATDNMTVLAVKGNGTIHLGQNGSSDTGERLQVNGSGKFSDALTVTTTGTFGFQDYRTQATQKVLVLNGEGVSGQYSPSLFNVYTKPGTTVNGIASIIIKSKYGSDAESGNLFEFKGNGDAAFTGNITAANFSGSSSGTNTGDQTLAGLGGVGGSGTNGRVPKWTSSSALGDSVITDNGTNVRVANPFLADSRLAVGTNGGDQTYASVFVGGAITTGTSQYAFLSDPQLAGTDNYALFANARIKANTAVTNTFGVYIPSAEKLSGASIVNNYALYIANQTAGTTTNYSIYSSGGLNYLNGNTSIGTTQSTNAKLQVNSSSISSGGSGLWVYGFDGAANFYTTRGESVYNTALYLYNNPSAGQGYGTGISFRAKSDTTDSRAQGIIYTTWATATDASRTSNMVFGTTNAGVTGDKMWLTGSGRLGINQASPSGMLHVTSPNITASAPSLGWPVYNSEADTNARSIYIDTSGNSNTSTAGYGATVALILGQYYDSRAVITTVGSGGASPGDQGTGHGKDLLIKGGTSDNGIGYKGGRLYLNGGMGYGAGGYNANGGHVIMQSLTGSGNVGINTDNPTQKLHVSGYVRTNGISVFKTGGSVAGFIGHEQDWLGSGSSNNLICASEGGNDFKVFTNGTTAERITATSTGYVYLGKGWSASNHRINLEVAQGNKILVISAYSGTNNDSVLINAASGANPNAASTVMEVTTNSSTGRSISAGGTINASGNDYAEYMLKATTDTINKGDIVGVNIDGKLTNIFNEAISFVVKSTDPSYVGGDNWFNDEKRPSRTTDQTEEEFAPILADFESRLEIERSKVDRIAFSGQVPVNVTGATVGDYIIPIETEYGKITGQAITNPSFDQYKISVGKVWKIMEDGRAFIAVKIG